MSEVITRDEWLKAMDMEGTRDYPEALTTSQLQTLLGGVGVGSVKTRIKQMLKEGKVKLVKKRVVDASGRGQLHPAYLLVKKEKK